MSPPYHRLIQVTECLMGEFEHFARKAHHQRLSLQFLVPDDLPPLLIDAVSFARVFQLLVHRALDVTLTGGVTVRAKRAAGGILFWVTDGGPWVAPRDIPRLFFGPSSDPDLVAASGIARRLEALLTATSGAEQKGLRVRLFVPMVPTLC